MQERVGEAGQDVSQQQPLLGQSPPPPPGRLARAAGTAIPRTPSIGTDRHRGTTPRPASLVGPGRWDLPSTAGP